jgi:hypothetical protein
MQLNNQYPALKPFAPSLKLTAAAISFHFAVRLPTETACLYSDTGHFKNRRLEKPTISQ